MENYNTYIELSPDYESVIDIDSENRNPDMWKNYIVHEDMRDLLDAVCKSLSFEDLDKRRSFWIHGAYGTGKTYAAIVLKHLFEDSVESIRPFLSNQFLIPYREKFIAQREKGKYLVVWKSQTTDIKSGTQLMMAIELAIREKLREEYGDKAYYGKDSLIYAAKKEINNSSINWHEIFDNSPLGLYDDYTSLEDFKHHVEDGNLRACNYVATIFRNNGWGFFSVIDDFKRWLQDIIEGNHLQETGIIFIWDEFTTYLRDNPNDDVLQPLSEYCKEQPFFLCLIVHKDASWLVNVGEETYDRIVHRYHSVEFYISEDAAYELIGSSILTRAGMEEQWKIIQNNLMKSINKNLADFDNLNLNSPKDRFRRLCPLHPMTLSMLTIVADNFGASQRTLFRFMKDRQESFQNVGFTYYINNYGYDNWRWLTPDFLWDYFFLRESDVKDFSTEAKSAYQHFITYKDHISDEYHMHIFKAAMLLIAVVSSGNVSNLYSRTVNRKIASTKTALYKCFAGVLDNNDVDDYLNDLVEIGLIRLDEMANGDCRLQIPYSGGVGNVFEFKKEEIKKNHTRYELFKKNGIFAKAIEDKFADNAEVGVNRLYFAAASFEMTSIKNRLDEMKKELEKYPYKFGILIIAIDEPSKFSSMQQTVKSLATDDTTGRLAICLLKSPLAESELDRWYTARTHSELAKDEGKFIDADNYSSEADLIVSEWSGDAGDGQIMAVCGSKVYSNEYGAFSLIADLEKEIIFGTIFTAAPELIVTINTAYKKMQATTPEYGVRKEEPNNSQILNVVNGLKSANAWDANSLEEMRNCTGNSGAEAIAEIAKFISIKFAQGTQIKLDEMWLELQKPPFGYYNCIACGYILGFVLRFFVNSGYSWDKGDNNPWPFTEKNIGTMIKDMCDGKVINNYLSPGSEVWQKFKQYVQKVFLLTDNETVNDIEARKYMSRQCTEKAGVPFWSLKYLSSEYFGGVSAKKIADEIIDLFCDFMLEKGDQESVMGNIITKFKGNGKIRDTLSSLYFDQDIAYNAFSLFISSNQGEIEKFRTEIGLSGRDMFDAIHQLMQGQVSTWTEEEVKGKLYELSLEYHMLDSLNKSLGVKRKSIMGIAKDIKNAFGNMIVPGSVIEKMGYEWIPTLKVLKEISEDRWANLSINDKEEDISLIDKEAQYVWDNVTSAKSILKKYLDNRGSNYTDEELDSIFISLTSSQYDTSAADFENKIIPHLNKISYNRNVTRIKELWRAQSGFDTVQEWCNNYAVPIQWLVPEDALPHISILYSIQNGEVVGDIQLQNATQYFENLPLDALHDNSLINDAFFANVGENYRPTFDTSKKALIARLKTYKGLSSNVYSWSNKVGTIREALDGYLREKYCDEAKQNIMNMKEDDLQNRVIDLLDENPDLYTFFIKREGQS